MNSLVAKPYSSLTLNDIIAYAGVFSRSGLTGKNTDENAVKIMMGLDLGLTPSVAVNGIHIINGKPTFSANLIALLVKSSPTHQYKVLEHTEKACAIEFFQFKFMGNAKWTSLGISSFSAEEARKGGVKNMDKWAKAMLFARALTQGVRWYCPEVMGGITAYTPDEVGGEVVMSNDGDGEIVRVIDMPATAVKPEAPTTTSPTSTTTATTTTTTTAVKPEAPTTTSQTSTTTPVVASEVLQADVWKHVVLVLAKVAASNPDNKTEVREIGLRIVRDVFDVNSITQVEDEILRSVLAKDGWYYEQLTSWGTSPSGDDNSEQ